MMGPFGSSVASTVLWFMLCLPYIFAKAVNNWSYRTFMHFVVVPVLVSVYISVPSVSQYFLVPWEVIIPLFSIIYGILMLISLVSKTFKKGLDECDKPNMESSAYVTLAIFLLLMFGMLAYYYTPLFSMFSPLASIQTV